MKKLTYAEAGVDILKERKAVASLVGKVKFSRHGIGKPLALKGHYAGLISFGDYALVLCTDGVGTKTLVAEAIKKYDTIGIDCIAMNVNDCICVGAEPLAFVDYLAVQKPEEKLVKEIGKGLNRGARLANVSIVGGELAILPELLKGFDLAGTCLGLVKRNKIITGERIKVGDLIIGLRSSGLHSNGLTLARKVLMKNKINYSQKFPSSIKTWGEILLEPTRIYVREILKVLKYCNPHGLAHITGGGLRKLSRINRKVNFSIEEPFEAQPIFKILQKLGKIDTKEMYQTFNMGIGFCVISSKQEANKILDLLDYKIEAKIIGNIKKGRGVSIPKLRIQLEP